MITTFLVNVEIDSADLEREASRNGYTQQAAQTAILADLENKLHSAVKWRECVRGVGVQVFSRAIAGQAKTAM